jgi:outer membrane protein TolC
VTSIANKARARRSREWARSRWWTVVLIGLLTASPALAEELAGHRHAPLPVDPYLSLSTTIDAALAAYPDLPMLDARAQEADAWVQRGRSIVARRPSLVMRYQSDRLGSDAGLEEYEAGLELPLWSPGGRRAVEALGDALVGESGAAAVALRWEVGGLVRMALWNVASAEADRELAEQALETAATLVRKVERRYELGDVALGDVLLTRTSYLEYEAEVTQANASVLDAERMFRTISGLDRRPEFLAEARSEAVDIGLGHPALALANAAIERAEADVTVVTKTQNSGATVFVGTRHEQPAGGLELDDSIGVIVNIPFGGSSHRNTAISAAARVAAATVSRRDRQLRELTLAMHEAAHSLNVVHENLATARERLQIAEQQQKMGELAYEKGELGILDLLRIQAVTIAAKRQVTGLAIDQRRQTALYNQAVGDIP